MLIVRYGEIGLKGRNRRTFEERLARNIEIKLKKYGYSGKTKILRGRIFVYAPDESAPLIARCPGVVSVSPAREMNYEDVFQYLSEELRNYSPKTFKVQTKRVDKRYPMTSQEINEKIGTFVVENFGWMVNLKEPEFIIGVEIVNGKLYVYFETIRGVGGLPVGSTGKLVLLLSPGIDSPVAGYMMLKRGAKLVALHMKHSEDDVKKIKRILDVLNTYSPKDIELVVQEHGKLLEDIHKQLCKIHREKWLCVFCKYTMIKAAGALAKRQGALGIVTGDSLGQVASQTLENMYIESQATDYPVYRPLIGMDKNEIESIARDIGTYDVFLSMGKERCPFKPRYVVVQGDYEEFEKIRTMLEI